MTRVAGYLNSLSLRRRFLIAPLLALVLFGLLTGAYIFESGRQNMLLERLAEQEFASFNRYFEIFTGLSAQHTALYALLARSTDRGGEAWRKQTKDLLSEINLTVHTLEQASEELAERRGQAAADLAALHGKLVSDTQEYQRTVGAAVVNATTDVKRSAGELAEANQRFTMLNRTFADVLGAQQTAIRNDIAAQTRRSELSDRIIAVAGLLAAILLVMLSRGLSRLLARALETQVDVLTRLGAEAGGSVAVQGEHIVQRLEHAVAAFRDVLLRLRGSERDLRKARDELEERVRERTRELSQANASLRLYEQVVRSTGEAVVIADRERTIIEVNPAYEQTTGRARKEVVGTRLYADAPEPHVEKTYSELWERAEADGRWTGEILDRRKNGEAFPAWAMINAVRDERGEIQHYVSVTRDITVLKENEQQLKKLAFYDALTGLANRALFNDRLNVALATARRQNTHLAVLYVDLDRFKYVNDTLGHPAGDRLLVEIAGRIGRCVRAADTLSRMGGDEFTVLLTHLLGDDDAEQIAQRIVETVGMPVALGEQTVYVGASVGISFHPADALDAETLHKHADLAMYAAKQAGRGQYKVFNEEMLDKGGEHLTLSAEIDSALNRGEFMLFYQPIVDAATGHPDGVEALIRWRKASGEWIPPARFIPHAEQAGLIKRIDCWVLEEACGQAARWNRESARRLRISVNLSSVSLQQGEMAKQIRDVLERTGLPPAQLNIEITETAVISSPKVALGVLQEIVALGVTVSMDDFGTGYSSLNYLTQFPINCIKLDQTFVGRIGEDKANEQVISSLLDLARKLSLHVVAEGVEQGSQRQFLEKQGCKLVQGFHIGKPMSAADLNSWLAGAGATGAAAA